MVKKNDGGPLRGSVIVLDHSSTLNTSRSERRATRRAFHLLSIPFVLPLCVKPLKTRYRKPESFSG